MGWITPLAPTKEELEACVQCGLCLPACPTFRLTGDETASPRGRLTAMAAVASGVAAVDETFAGMMEFCLQCRACETACPSLVPFGRAMEGARAEVAAQLPSARRAARTALVGRRGLGRRPAVQAVTRLAGLAQRLGIAWAPGAAGRGLQGLRRLPSRSETSLGANWPAIGTERGVVGLLAGCVMDRWFLDVHLALAFVLRRAGYRVVVPEAQSCCGALAAHDGSVGEAEAMAERNRDAFAGVDVVVADAAGCSAHLKELAAEHRGALPPVFDAVEVVAASIRAGWLPELEENGRRVAVQDPCHLRHAQQIVDEPRAVVRAGGYEVLEIDPDGMCCGAAGIYSLSHPATSAELGRRKADQMSAAGATIVASANPGCEMQLRAHAGDSWRIVHPVELYAEALAAAGPAAV